MPVSKKRKKDDRGRSRERGDAPAAPKAPTADGGGSRGGMLSRMRGGFQNMTGAGPKKKESMLSKVITWVILLVALYFIARRFGILK
jgi:hypothetical protein